MQEDYPWDWQWWRLAFATSSYWQIIDRSDGRWHLLVFGLYWRTRKPEVYI